MENRISCPRVEISGEKNENYGSIKTVINNFFAIRNEYKRINAHKSQK